MTNISDAFAWLESQQSQMTADLVELANQNSGSDNLTGLLQVADWLEDWCDFRQSNFQRIHLPPRHVIRDDGDELAIETAPALRWDFRPAHAAESKPVLLAIHYDTVFPVGSRFQTCELLTPDKLCGPGVADAKGGIVTMRFALRALQQFELGTHRGWTVLLNPDEEVGSPSSAGLLAEIAKEFAFGLLFEPALPTGELVAERKGSGNFDIVVHGKSAHAGRHFEDGRNAVAALCTILTQLDALNNHTAGLTVNVGAVCGGGPVNVVPELAVGRLNVRLKDTTSGAWFMEHLDAIVEHTNARPGFRVQRFGGISSPPKTMCEATQQLMRDVENATLASGGQPVRWKSTGGVCDGNKLAAAGLPNIDTLGPVGDHLHSTEEWVRPSSLVSSAKRIVQLLASVQ